jgi:lia operon protein LiaG
VDLESVSGGIQAKLGRGTVSARMATTSGDIHLRLAGIGCELEAETTSGDIETSVAMQIREVTRRRVAGRVGSGETPVRLRTSSGDIDVAEAE